MISAREALALPCAQLTDEEQAKVAKLEVEIEEHIRRFMAVRGVNFSTKETEPNVIAEVVGRLRAVGWLVEWQPLGEPHPLNKAKMLHIGWKLDIAPTQEARAPVAS